MYSIVMRVYEFDVNVNPTLCHRKPLDSLQSVMGTVAVRTNLARVATVFN